MKPTMFSIVLLVLALTTGCAQLVYVSNLDGNDQVYRMRATGASKTNISDNEYIDHFPDVSPDGKKIVFSSLRQDPGEHIYIMDTDGRNLQQITSGNLQRTMPRWSPEGLIAFAYPSYTRNEKIWTIRSDGTEMHQVTNPGPNESDDGGHDFYAGGQRIVFSRYNRTTRDRDLYSIYFDGTQGLEQITVTSDISETLPVVSHDERFLAYRVFHHDGSEDTIRIVDIGTWALVKEIVFQPPADQNIFGLDFSGDDRRLFVGIESSDVSDPDPRKKLEIFSIKTDGTGQKQLTNNEVEDYWPSGIPCRRCVFWCF